MNSNCEPNVYGLEAIIRLIIVTILIIVASILTLPENFLFQKIISLIISILLITYVQYKTIKNITKDISNKQRYIRNLTIFISGTII